MIADDCLELVVCSSRFPEVLPQGLAWPYATTDLYTSLTLDSLSVYHLCSGRASGSVRLYLVTFLISSYTREAT